MLNIREVLITLGQNLFTLHRGQRPSPDMLLCFEYYRLVLQTRPNENSPKT